MQVIDRASLARGDYGPAAEIAWDFDDLLARLRATARLHSFRDKVPFPHRYRELCLRLSSGRGATLTQTEMRSSRVEIGLMIEEDEFFQEADLAEVVAGLGIEADHVRKIRGEFKWRAGDAVGE